ncbi:MAG: hypothetical protein U0792_00350 [Gemmataceae bacterium]
MAFFPQGILSANTPAEPALVLWESTVPIHFRCPDCKKRLGIARRKAGTITICPHCSEFVTVPLESEGASGAPEPVDLDEIDDLINEGEAARPASPSGPVAPPSIGPNVELIPTVKSLQAVPRPQPVATPQPPSREHDVPTTGNRSGQVVVSFRQALLLVVLGATLLFVAFVSGYMVGTKDAPSTRPKKPGSTSKE